MFYVPFYLGLYLYYMRDLCYILSNHLSLVLQSTFTSPDCLVLYNFISNHIHFIIVFFSTFQLFVLYNNVDLTSTLYKLLWSIGGTFLSHNNTLYASLYYTQITLISCMTSSLLSLFSCVMDLRYLKLVLIGMICASIFTSSSVSWCCHWICTPSNLRSVYWIHTRLQKF